MNNKIKPPFSYYGGKQKMFKYIEPIIPKHTTYVEAFAGSASIFWMKKPSNLEILNDTNREMMNFYEVVKHDFVSLQKEIEISLHSRDLHRDAFTVYENPHLFTPLKRAWAIWVLGAQGFGGMLSSSWGRDKKQNKAVKTVASKRECFTVDYSIRLQHVTLESRDAIRVIKTTDYNDAFFYVDPPYYNADMGHYDGYTIEDFRMLLEALSGIEGKFLLSSYPSKLLSECISRYGWHSFELEMNVAVSNRGKRKVEVLTANYPIEKKF